MTGVMMLGKAGEWETIGSLADNQLWNDEFAGDTIEDFDTATLTTTTEQSMSLTLLPTLPSDSAWYDLIGGPPARPEPTHAVLITHKVPFRDVPPRKRRGLTGKAYRIARRRFRRERTAWVRAGRPLLDAAIYLPRVRIEPVIDG